MSSAEVEALATTPLRHLAEQHLVETPPSSLLPEMLGVTQQLGGFGLAGKLFLEGRQALEVQL